VVLGVLSASLTRRQLLRRSYVLLGVLQPGRVALL
jgi:hypothetical protein